MAGHNQNIRVCTSRDGVRIAYAVMGRGPPLVKAPNYLTHLGYDESVWGHWLAALSRRHTLVRYDERGTGMSDRGVDNLSIDAWVQDLAAVIDDLQVGRTSLLGISQGASVCIAYAVRYPEKVSRLVLYGGYARGRLRRDPSPDEVLEAETMVNAMRVGWGRNNPAFRQLFSTQLMPDAAPGETMRLNELARVSASPASAARLERAFYQIEVSHLARRVAAPTLVLHAERDRVIPFDEGRRLAALIPGATFVPLDSQNHILLEREPAWRTFVREVEAFLGARTAPADAEEFGELTDREREILDLLADGLSNDDIAVRLHIAEKTVRNHITHIYSKLHVSRRAQAIILARDAGLGHRVSH